MSIFYRQTSPKSTNAKPKLNFIHQKKRPSYRTHLALLVILTVGIFGFQGHQLRLQSAVSTLAFELPGNDTDTKNHDIVIAMKKSNNGQLVAERKERNAGADDLVTNNNVEGQVKDVAEVRLLSKQRRLPPRLSPGGITRRGRISTEHARSTPVQLPEKALAGHFVDAAFAGENIAPQDDRVRNNSRQVEIVVPEILLWHHVRLTSKAFDTDATLLHVDALEN